MIMPNMNRFSTALVIALLAAAAFAAPAEPTKQYDSGYQTMARLGDDLYRALPKEKRATLLARPVLLDNIKLPYLQPGAQAKDGTNLHAVFVSPALFEVLNYISHARAVDSVDDGFFAKAVNSLACDNGDKGLPPLYQPTHEKSWAFNTMNGQLSYFNQMAAGLMAIEMAHYHLGHYSKYAGQLGDSKKPAPLYSVLSQKEWREAVLTGSRHALDCGLAPEGLIVLYDAISRMPQRPSWAVHLMPPAAEVSILRLELKRVEASFFDARTAVREEFRWSW
jgi:hypothetical protein